MKQQNLFDMPNLDKPFSVKTGSRRIQRPLSTRRPVHLILKAEQPLLRKNQNLISHHWNRLGQRQGVKTYHMAIERDHIHAIVRLHSRETYQKFIRSFCGLSARLLKIKWRHRPTTRIAHWGKDYQRLAGYVRLNEWEAAGYIKYEAERTRNLPEWLKVY
ncbi:MAG: transposase [Bdellovibrionales bacterium]